MAKEYVFVKKKTFVNKLLREPLAARCSPWSDLNRSLTPIGFLSPESSLRETRPGSGCSPALKLLLKSYHRLMVFLVINFPTRHF